jgi:hypothetical protein
MKLNELKAAIEILTKYYNNPAGYHVGADHDQIYFFRVDKSMDDKDIEKLRDLGFFQPHVNDEVYNPQEGWSAYT